MPRPRSPEEKQGTLDRWIKKEEKKEDVPLETLPEEEQKKKPIEEKEEKMKEDEKEKPKENDYYDDDEKSDFLRPFR